MMRLAAIVALASCRAPAAPPEQPDNEVPEDRHVILASIERTGCFGWCPIYSLSVFRDGSLAYSGSQFVKTVGPATGQLAPADVTALDELFTRAGFAQLRDEYMHVSATDSPSVTISYRPRGELAKTIHHYLGDDTAPDALVKLEEDFDRVVHSDRFIGTHEEREQQFARH